MTDLFYRAFEEKFRGSRDLIKSRLRVYLPFITTLLELYPEANCIDLGCGRGEWLELLDEAGFQSYGVDLDKGMLAACYERGLNVELNDAIAALMALPDKSQVVVSGFHIVEHLPFADLQVLVQEALRVLKPAGLLIMETPNPENLVVGTASFYLDPTHQRPIPPQLLSFLPEYYGFGRIKIIRLHEHSDLATSETLQLMHVLEGTSPDYAVVAQKPADPEMLAVTDDAFGKDYGLSLEFLAASYNKTIVDRISHAETVAQSADGRAQRAETVVQSAESRTQQLAAELQGVYAGRSWRLTKPLRWLGRQIRFLRQQGLAARIKAIGKKIALPLIRRVFFFVSARPGLRFRCVILAQRLGCYSFLRILYRRHTGQDQHHREGEPGVANQFIVSSHTTAQLTPHARRIYQELTSAVKRNKESL